MQMTLSEILTSVKHFMDYRLYKIMFHSYIIGFIQCIILNKSYG